MLYENWGDRVPVDPYHLAKVFGIVVEEKPLDADLSGYISQEGSGTTVILLNEADSRCRKRFTCAHELGHFVKHTGSVDSFGYVDYRHEAVSLSGHEDERFADAFAAALLMPDHRVAQRDAIGESATLMADYFEVSAAAMVNRLRRLGLL